MAVTHLSGAVFGFEGFTAPTGKIVRHITLFAGNLELSLNGTRYHSHFVAMWDSAALIPWATDSVSAAAQKCMKKRRGCSVSMWLCNAVT